MITSLTKILTLLAALALATLWHTPVAAGGFSRAHEPAHFTSEQIADFSKQVERVAATQGARVFLVGRIGRPPEELPKGVHFTHIGLAVYGQNPTKDGRVLPGYRIYNLYQDDEEPNRSTLVTDYPLDFFSGVEVLESAVIIPTPALQKKLAKAVQAGTHERLHNPQYSVISNPFDLRYQNCTEYMLDVINAAIYGTEDRKQLKRNARAYFTPLEIQVDPIKLLLGSLFSAEVSTADHEGPIRIATFPTIVAYLEQYGLVKGGYRITPEGITPWTPSAEERGH